MYEGFNAADIARVASVYKTIGKCAKLSAISIRQLVYSPRISDSHLESSESLMYPYMKSVVSAEITANVSGSGLVSDAWYWLSAASKLVKSVVLRHG